MFLQLLTKRGLTFLGLLLVIASVCFVIYIRLLFTIPTSFTDARSFTIESGMSVRDIAQKAQDEGIVRSNLLLYTILTYSHDPTNIYAGTYTFNKPVGVFGVAQKLANKDIEKNLVRITIPEGVRLTEIASTAAQVLPNFDVDEYLINTNELEGYLFPETYFVPETFNAQNLIELQKETYEQIIAPLRDQIALTPFTEYEVLILASIIEREANDAESMKTVSGVFQNRLDIGMPLQADATIEYVLDTPLNELPEGQLATELRETESPYNTYLNTGLIPTPIGNPGAMAIEAVLNPIDSDYIFYITGTDGTFHYAQTLQEHNQNIAKYLR